MTKSQMIALFIAMIITSALVSGATMVGGIWYLHKQSGPETSDSGICLLYTSPSPRDLRASRMPSSA